MSEERPRAPRPTAIDPQQLGYTPRRPVPWLGPVLLAGTAIRVGLAQLFGAYLDKRELQSALPATVHDERPPIAPGSPPAADAPDDPEIERDDHAEVWLDYVADLGDGFDPTYAVAYLLAAESLTVDGELLPRGRFLVMGGDQAYPTADGQQYEDRCKGPYRTALPEPPTTGERPSLYAVPGNHDWYDGLTAFLRLFARLDHGEIGGWATKQSRSYFTVRLPNRWWLMAIDVQPGAYLDDPQLRCFRQSASHMRPGDRVILCTPTPGWVQAAQAPEAYSGIDYFVRTVIAPTGADVRLMLSGDLHHYARYTECTSADAPPRQLVTCGGGGAYLSSTHRLPDRIEVPPVASLVRETSPPKEYHRTGTYPTKSRSRRYAAGVFHRLPKANPGFVTALGVLHLLLMYAMANAASRIAPGVVQRLVTIPLLVMVAFILGSTLLFAMPSGGRRRRQRHWLFGLCHGLAHLGLGAVGTLGWNALPVHRMPWPLPELTAIVLYLPLIGLFAALVVAGYLLLASVFDVNVNELFAAQSIIDAKCFLRIRIDAGGTLTIYPIAVDRVPRRWLADPDGAPSSPWLSPATPLEYRLAEPPIRVR